MSVRRFGTLLAAVLLAAACSGSGRTSVVVYTSVTQATVDAVTDAFAAAHPDIEVEVFRAPTGEINARIAAERASGGIEADVLWMTDPLSMFAYDGEGLLASADPDGVDRLPEAFVTDRFWGTRTLHLVVVARPGTVIESWADLTDPGLAVALPDPGFAGSAYAAVGYLSSAYGFEFFDTLERNGATEVPAPGDVVTGVAEGRFDAGITLDYSARIAEENGSPIRRIWPDPGAITFSSPIGLVDAGGAARTFVEFVLSDKGQQAIAGTGWIPVVDVAGGPERIGSEVFPDWEDLASSREDVLARYDAIFGS
jgi:iron(III) transport system substrate-binding protein